MDQHYLKFPKDIQSTHLMSPMVEAREMIMRIGWEGRECEMMRGGREMNVGRAGATGCVVNRQSSEVGQGEGRECKMRARGGSLR